MLCSGSLQGLGDVVVLGASVSLWPSGFSESLAQGGWSVVTSWEHGLWLAVPHSQKAARPAGFGKGVGDQYRPGGDTGYSKRETPDFWGRREVCGLGEGTAGSITGARKPCERVVQTRSIQDTWVWALALGCAAALEQRWRIGGPDSWVLLWAAMVQ